MATPTVGLRSSFGRGSEWRRWDLHVHTPNTAREDGYDDWPSFIKAVSSLRDLAVIGVTDYLSIRNYSKLLGVFKSEGLGDVELLIPNVEFRISPPTKKGQGVNIHLLIDPSETGHETRINSALSRLAISYGDHRYSCL